MIHFFTIVARNYIGLAITLGDSVVAHHPDSAFTIVVADSLESIDSSRCRFNLLDARKAFNGDFENVAFKYDVTEFCTALKPHIFLYLLEQQKNETVVYLDPDTYLYAPLDPILSDLHKGAICLTPHLLDYHSNVKNPYPDWKHLWEGIFNLGFCAVRRCDESTKVMHWWSERLLNYCFIDREDGLHTDQKWCDYLPVLLGDNLIICRHPGVNVSHWNLAEREISFDRGKLLSNGEDLILFHFSGFDPAGKAVSLRNTKSDYSHLLSPAVCSIIEEHRLAVLDNGFYDFFNIPYKYGFYDNGVPVTKLHRRILRGSATGLSEPFSASREFYRRLKDEGLIDKSPEAKLNYRATSISNLESKKFFLEMSFMLILRLVGVKNFCLMLKIFSIYQRPENHKHLVNRVLRGPS